MKIAFGLLAVAGIAASALAGPILPAAPEQGSLVIDLNGNIVEDISPAVDVTRYDNWTNPPSALTGVFNTGGAEIADDLNMTGMGHLGNVGVNIANTGTTAWAATGGSGIIRFYRQSDGSFIGGFGFNLPALNLAVNSSTRLQFGDGALAGLNIWLDTTNIFMSVQYTALNGASLATVGMQTRGPVGIGTSTDNMINVGSGNFNFNGAPLANGGLKVAIVPTPASLALLGLGGLAAARRRR